MVSSGWDRLYLDALIRGRESRLRQFESVDFFAQVLDQSDSTALELLLYRTLPRLRFVDEALTLLELLKDSSLDNYRRRLLSRITDYDLALKIDPGASETLRQLLKSKRPYTASKLTEWHFLYSGPELVRKGSPLWLQKNAKSIFEILPDSTPNTFGIDEILSVLQYLKDNDVRLYQVGLITGSSQGNLWAESLHRILAVPYIDVGVTHDESFDDFVENTPAPHWAPHWQIGIAGGGWVVYEAHTAREMPHFSGGGLSNALSVLVILGGMLRDGFNLTPIDDGLVRTASTSHPLWGLRRRDFTVADTPYKDNDVRAFALGFLEGLPDSHRVRVFRARLAFHFLTRDWSQRSTASIITSRGGYYDECIEIARLFEGNQFKEVLARGRASTFQDDPVIRFMISEAHAALELKERIDNVSFAKAATPATGVPKIVCVTHASVPEQSGGYAIRAHGILRSLQEDGISVTAVTRPGFPDGVLTEQNAVQVDGVTYHRLPATEVPRTHGEAQHMLSYISLFKEFFAQQSATIVHLRSTFLIALPALIAARELGLKVLYEVSGLWELVYKDRETHSHVLKRSSFAESAEKLTMQNVDQVVVMNQAVRGIAVARGVDPKRISMAPNAVDTSLFQPLAPPENDIFTVGYLGSFQDYEGIEDLIRAVQLLREENVPVQALLVGDGLRFNAIRTRVRREKLEAYVKLIGRVPHNEVLEYYRHMDVLVYPRRSTNATRFITPLKPFEALALAKPIIVSDVPPLREIVGDEARGLHFASGNVEDLSNAIRQLREDAGLRRRLGEAGRSWVVKHRNWKSVAKTFAEAYGQLNYS